MNEVIVLRPTPKQESYNYEGQRYILKFEPYATEDRRWSWCVLMTKTYQFFGHAATIDLAGRQARDKIRKLMRREELDA
jgi:hypothetical protein